MLAGCSRSERMTQLDSERCELVLEMLLDEAPADPLKEILGVSSRLLHEPRIVAVFDFRLLQYKFHSDFRPVSSLDEGPGALCESGSIWICFWRRWRQAVCYLACVLTKLRSG